MDTNYKSLSDVYSFLYKLRPLKGLHLDPEVVSKFNALWEPKTSDDVFTKMAGGIGVDNKSVSSCASIIAEINTHTKDINMSEIEIGLLNAEFEKIQDTMESNFVFTQKDMDTILEIPSTLPSFFFNIYNTHDVNATHHMQNNNK